jgi:protein-L-isoaspartate O-methyltransferase
MQKGGTSDDVLEQTIAKAIATVSREKYRNPVSQEQPYRCS